MFDILGAGDGTQLGVASENDVLEARKEAIPNSIEPGCRLRFARNYSTTGDVVKFFIYIKNYIHIEKISIDITSVGLASARSLI